MCQCAAPVQPAHAHRHHSHSLLLPPYAGRSCTTGPMWCACRRWTTSARWVPGEATGVKLLCWFRAQLAAVGGWMVGCRHATMGGGAPSFRAPLPSTDTSTGLCCALPPCSLRRRCSHTGRWGGREEADCASSGASCACIVCPTWLAQPGPRPCPPSAAMHTMKCLPHSSDLLLPACHLQLRGRVHQAHWRQAGRAGHVLAHRPAAPRCAPITCCNTLDGWRPQQLLTWLLHDWF